MLDYIYHMTLNYFKAHVMREKCQQFAIYTARYHGRHYTA